MTDPIQFTGTREEFLAKAREMMTEEPRETRAVEDQSVFDMTTVLREAYEIRTGQTIDDAVSLRMALEEAFKSEGWEIRDEIA